jgi:hypothetical protein
MALATHGPPRHGWLRIVVGVILVTIPFVLVIVNMGTAHSPHPTTVKRGSCDVKMRLPGVRYPHGTYNVVGRARIQNGCGGKRISIYLAQQHANGSWFTRPGEVGVYVTDNSHLPLTGKSIPRSENCPTSPQRFATMVRIGSCGSCDNGAYHRDDQMVSVNC